MGEAEAKDPQFESSHYILIKLVSIEGIRKTENKVKVDCKAEHS